MYLFFYFIFLLFEDGTDEKKTNREFLEIEASTVVSWMLCSAAAEAAARVSFSCEGEEARKREAGAVKKIY